MIIRLILRKTIKYLSIIFVCLSSISVQGINDSKIEVSRLFELPKKNKNLTPQSIQLLDTIQGCNKIEWANWSHSSTYLFTGNSKFGQLATIELDSSTMLPIQLFSLELISPILIPKIVPGMPTPYFPGSGIFTLKHKIKFNVKNVQDIIFFITSVTNSKKDNNSLQHTKISAYDSLGNRLDISNVKLLCSDPTIYYLAKTQVIISSNEIDLTVDDANNLSEGDALLFNNFPLNTSYIIVEHNDDKSYIWDSVYLNIGLPDCCPRTNLFVETIPCTGDSNAYSVNGFIDLMIPHPTGSIYILIDNKIVQTVNPPFSNRLLFDIGGLSPDGMSHTLSFYSGDAPDCIQTISYIATSPIAPPAITGNTPICEQATLLLSTDPGHSYTWSGPNGFSANTNNIIIPGATQINAGIYQLTITDVNGCTSSASIDVTNILPISVINQAQTACDSILINGVSYYTSGRYIQKLIKTNGCDSILALDLTINGSTPDALDAGKDTSICEGDFVNLQGSYSGQASYLWQSGNGSFDNPSALLTRYYPGTTGDYRIYLSSVNQCRQLIDSLNIQVLPKQIVQITGDPNVDPCKEITFTATGGTNYIWTPASQIECLDPACKTVRLKSGGSTIFTITTDGPCVEPASLQLTSAKIQSDLFLPNVFSPNGDNVNDFFLPIVHCEQLDYYHLQIFDRWGNLVFETFDKDLGWNGKFGSEPMNPAVFVFVVEYQFPGSARQMKNGDVTLVK